MAVQAVPRVNPEDKRTQFTNFYKQYAANMLYHKSYNINATGIKTEGAYKGLYGEGFGRFSEKATGMITGPQDVIHNFELTA